MGDAQQAGAFWDREIEQQNYVSWMADDQVREYINRSVDPVSGGWPLDWFQRSLGGRRFRRALSVGCGAGSFERDVIRRDLAGSIVGVDASIHSLAIARSEAAAAGLSSRIRYAAIDFNRIEFPRAGLFDLVIFHQSAHHVAALESAFARILDVISDDGVLYLDEYIGPSRFEWNRHTLRVIRGIYESIPRAYRTHDELPVPIAAADPSEAIRSSEIVSLLQVGFDIRELRGYGGNVLSLLFPNIRWRAVTDRDSLVRKLIETERQILSWRGHEPMHAVIVAAPKKGRERHAAIQKYRRSISRVLFMLRRHLRRSAFPPVTGHG